MARRGKVKRIDDEGEKEKRDSEGNRAVVLCLIQRRVKMCIV